MTLINKTKFLSDGDFLVCMLYKYSYYNSTYYLQHTTDWTELNVLLYDGTRVLTGLLLCVWLRLTTNYDDDELMMIVIPRLHDEAGSTSARRAGSTSARRASSSSQLHRVNGV